MSQNRFHSKNSRGKGFFFLGLFLPRIPVVFILFLLPLNSKGQDTTPQKVSPSLAEKIYLQLDATTYTTGNIIWFKCIVSKSQDHTPSTLSRVLYVELIGPNETVYETKLIKIDKGIGQGWFHLSAHFPHGTYLIRAYTQWNENFGAYFFFKQYIQVFSSNERIRDEKVISNITLLNDATRGNRLEASLNPFVIDSLHKSKLKVYVTLDNIKDSIMLKKGKDNAYQMDYTFDGECQMATLQFQTANQQQYSKTIVLDEAYVDFQFLPESGELVHGLTSKVGFKALDAFGKGMMVQGDIVDENETLITSFQSNILGMGSFILEEVDSAKNYYARLKSESDNAQTILYPLPDIAPMGSVLSAEKREGKILFTATTNSMDNDSASLRLSCRGVGMYEVRVSLREGMVSLWIPSNKFPEGIIACTLLDDRRRPLAERLYFNERAEERLQITATPNKASYAKRELSSLTVEVTNALGEPVSANVSLLAINKQQMGEMQSTRQNIQSYFLLDSELKGEIENPGFYFRGDSLQSYNLDALMLTQGWRKYNYSTPVDSLSYLPEPQLTVTGQVSSIYAKKRKKVADLTMMTFGTNKSIHTQKTDSLGRFRFSLGDETGQHMNILIQSSNKAGKKADYVIALDHKESPPLSFNRANTVGAVDSVVQVLVAKNKERDKLDKAFPLQSGNILIDEVEVIGYHMTPNRKVVMEEYGEPDAVIEGDAIRAKEEKWSYGLYSVLLFNFPDKVEIITLGNGNLYAKLHNSELTLVVIDGIPVKPWEYDLIPNIPPSEVSSFELIEYAKNFARLYCDLFPDDCGYGPVVGNVIAIYTYGKKGIYGTNEPVGIIQTSVPVFSEAREFYAPKYDSPQSDDWNKPDLRALIHWDPILTTDSLGKVAASYYNADNVGEVVVVVEAISENGQIGYQELEYEITGEEQDIIIVN